jgi:multidrug efflux pump
VLLTSGVALAGIARFFVLPVSPLPQVDFPTISVERAAAGASPDTMATSVATPLERRLGTIAGVTEMTSNSQVGTRGSACSSSSRANIDGAAREVQAAINATRVDLPATLRSNPTYRKATVGRAGDHPRADVGRRCRRADLRHRLEHRQPAAGAGRRRRRRRDRRLHAARGARRAAAVRAQPVRRQRRGRPRRDPGEQREPAEGTIEGDERRLQIYTQTPARRAADYAPMVVAWRNGAAVRLDDVAEVPTASRTRARSASSTASRR